MAVTAINIRDTDRYPEVPRDNPDEGELLAKDLLVNATSFFRDPQVFDLLAAQIIPDLVLNHAPSKPIRIWIAGCSTGEEAYSLGMLFSEAISAAKLAIKLQVFASDVDLGAITKARAGLYPRTIEADVSEARLRRFFSREEDSYRISPELRASVVFTVQDVLADRPFSRLDFVSCRSLLSHLTSQARAKVIALFHFALRQDGVLLLGTTATVGHDYGDFEMISKSHQLYRRTDRIRPGEFGRIGSTGDNIQMVARPGQAPAPSRQELLADRCRRMVMETYAPATVVINRRHECLYSLGPTDRYLRAVPGHPSIDLLAMAPNSTRTKLCSAIQEASRGNARIVISAGQTIDSAHGTFSIAVQPFRIEGEDLLLVSFVDDPKSQSTHWSPGGSEDSPRTAALQRELEALRTELQEAVQNLAISNEERTAINQEALSRQEEFQATNEELLTSKEELHSLNEELSALNSQLRETLERQCTTANDLQNVLFSIDVATLFLDRNLNIRFFTPATKALFAIIPSDIGRPLSDLSSFALDADLLPDARIVLRTMEPIDREIESPSGSHYIRRVLPYRTQSGGVEGVVITFADITERRHVTDELEIAKQQADHANAAKSRFLAATGHDLRQPLQTLALVQGLLAEHVESEQAKKLIVRLDGTLSAMSGMLNTLRYINQIEAGTVSVKMTDFPVAGLLDRLRDEFADPAQAKGLTLPVVPCSLIINSDPRLLEQMIRNLLSNALKYTRRGKVLLGCRRHKGTLSIEVWDTGIGIPENEILTIFEEFHQLDNVARERSRGLGLGLSIVQRLSTLLLHPVRVRSRPGMGSVFSIEVTRTAGESAPISTRGLLRASHREEEHARRVGSILIVEDDPDVRELLEVFLRDRGYDVTTACDGIIAGDLAEGGMVRPDLILADHTLPKGPDGRMLVMQLRELLDRAVPAIILTGEISSGTLSDAELQDCVQLEKPVKLKELSQAVQLLLARSPVKDQAHGSSSGDFSIGCGRSVVFVVDDDDSIRGAIRNVLEHENLVVEDYDSAEAFLADFRPGREACLVVDAYLPGMNGLTLLRRLNDAGNRMPAIMITGNSDVPMAVEAMKAGASDFIEKPISRGDLVACVGRALEQSRGSNKLSAWREDAANHIAELTPRQRQVMTMVLAGHPSKNIAADLGISQRTVENHRAAIMTKMGTKSLPTLARLALAATMSDLDKIERKSSM